MQLFLIVLVAQFADPVRWLALAVVAYVVRARAAAIAISAAVSFALWLMGSLLNYRAGFPMRPALAAAIAGAILGALLHWLTALLRRRAAA